VHSQTGGQLERRRYIISGWSRRNIPGFQLCRKLQYYFLLYRI